MTFLKKLKTTKLISLFFALTIAFSTFWLSSDKQPALTFKQPTITAESLYFDLSTDFETKSEIKTEVDSLFGNPPYTYAEKDINEWGLTYLPARHIVVDEALGFAEYTFTLAHELVHLTESTNERWANYRAFIVLFESGNEFFKNVAVFGAWLDLAGCYAKEYQFVGHVEQYLLHV